MLRYMQSCTMEIYLLLVLDLSPSSLWPFGRVDPTEKTK